MTAGLELLGTPSWDGTPIVGARLHALLAALVTEPRGLTVAQLAARAPDQASYGNAHNLRTLLQLYDRRLAALEDWVRTVELRLAELENRNTDGGEG